jgi:hypothetical protein
MVRFRTIVYSPCCLPFGKIDDTTSPALSRVRHSVLQPHPAVVSWNINTLYYLSSFVSYPIPGNEILNVGIANNQPLKKFVFDTTGIRSALFRPE